MADIAKGITLGVTEQITNTKLHDLVDSATISNIVNADIANDTIENSKIKTIATANKVSAISLSNLTSLATTAGVIPKDSLSITGDMLTVLTSLATLAGYIPSPNIIPSLASGATIKYDGTLGFYGEVIW